jgi:hypothetical protein
VSDPREDGTYNPTCDLCGESIEEGQLVEGHFDVSAFGDPTQTSGFVLVRCLICMAKTTVVDGGES